MYEQPGIRTDTAVWVYGNNDMAFNHHLAPFLADSRIIRAVKVAVNALLTSALEVSVGSRWVAQAAMMMAHNSNKTHNKANILPPSDSSQRIIHGSLT